MSFATQSPDRSETGAQFSSKILGALAAREALGHDFFGGWQASDLELFARHHQIAEGVPGFVTDYFGVKTASHLVPWAANNDGLVFSDPPVADISKGS